MAEHEFVTEGDAAIDELFSTLLFSPEVRAAPYAAYKELRERAPIYKTALGPWILTRYQDCFETLRDPAMGKDWAGFMLSSGIDDWRDHPSTRYGPRSMLFANPPEHTRLRRLVAKAFTPRTVERMRPAMEKTVDGMLDSIADAGGGDLLETLAFPLPVTVIGELLGVPESDRAAFRSRVRENTTVLEIGVTAEQIAAADESAQWMTSYFFDLVAEKRAKGGDDMLCRMIKVDDDGERFSDQELVEMGLLLFAAGFETTTNLIGNGMFCLLTNDDQLELLRADESLTNGTIEEILRFETSIQISGRSAMTDCRVSDVAIAAGDAVLTILGAANRDPARFTDPDRFDINRRGGEPMSFGSGIHYCLGASLARTEAAVVIGALLKRFTSIELAEEPIWRNQLGFHGLEKLDIRVSS